MAVAVFDRMELQLLCLDDDLGNKMKRIISKISGRGKSKMLSFSALAAPHFDSSWFKREYKIDDSVSDNEAYKIYLGGVQTENLSPNYEFSEEYYIYKYPDVYKAIQMKKFCCGFDHYIRMGRKEGRTARHDEYLMHDVVKYDINEDMKFDASWYTKYYHDVVQEMSEKNLTAIQHFNQIGVKRKYNPTAWFDEEWYQAFYPDVQALMDDGEISSGFEHYCNTGRAQGRIPRRKPKDILESKFPGVTYAKGIEVARMLEQKLRHVPVEMSERNKIRINFVMPSVDKDIMFGGYTSILHIIKKIVELGFDIRVLVTGDHNLSEKYALYNIRNAIKINTDNIEFENISERAHRINLSACDRFIAYSAWDALVASDLALCTDEKKILFLIQEDERIFHHFDSHRILIEEAYKVPQVSLFNTKDLMLYFEDKKIGRFSDSTKEDTVFYFEHLITQVSTPKIDELKARDTKRLLFYARPEAHAARNLFEIALLALKDSIKRGIFDRTWTFDGVGTLTDRFVIDLGEGCLLNMMPKLPGDDYGKLLSNYDVGLSLMYAPHPGLVHYEMASAAMIVVTNKFEYRDEKYFSDKSKNFIAAEPSIKSLSNALASAVDKVSDIESRVQNAFVQDAKSWGDVFTEGFILKILEALSVK